MRTNDKTKHESTVPVQGFNISPLPRHRYRINPANPCQATQSFQPFFVPPSN